MPAVSEVCDLVNKRCVPCEGGVPKFTPAEAAAQVAKLRGWSLSGDGKRIVKTWTVKNFVAGMAFFREVERVAEAEQHHPDLHLESYRNVRIELYTHAIDGLSENDFILAAKIDELPVTLKTRS
ncbi:MAG: 4a-hydroxytetrahydrobiopterin dehydratase [Pirellulales bacterium]